MESKTRHDLRHPLATISMIASTIAAFGDEVGGETVDQYRNQVVRERDDLKRLLHEHRVSLSLRQFDRLVDGFSASPTQEIAKSLDEICHELIASLSGGGADAA